MSGVLYHYCSLDAFLHIIKDSQIWLSDVSKSNDYKECMICKEYVDKEIREYLSNEEGALSSWELGISMGRESGPINIFCVCFSESRDQLSQWRGYADNGRGISIGFDKKLLEELNLINEYLLIFGKVLYDNIETYASSIIEESINNFNYKTIVNVALDLQSNFRLKFPFIKNQGFKEEKEWRIALNDSVINKRSIIKKDKYAISNIQYRVSNNKLIPYIELNFGEIKRQLIREIWLGPKSEVEIVDIMDFLEYCGYYEEDRSSEKPILIKKSKISYR